MVVVLESGAYRLMCKHIQLKGNVWYYRRRVPADVRKLHPDKRGRPKAQLFFSLETTSKMEAARSADRHTKRLDATWKSYRTGDTNGASVTVALTQLEAHGFKPGDALRYRDSDPITSFVDKLVGPYEPDEEPDPLSAQDELTLDILYGKEIPRTLSDAKEMHFSLGKMPKKKTGMQQFERAWDRLLSITGDIPLAKLRREHANAFVASLAKQGCSYETIRRYKSQIGPVIKTAIVEFELKMTNPFENLVIPGKNEGPRNPRSPFDDEQLRAIQKACREKDDQYSWLLGMLSDTGCRLAEVCGLRKSDVHLDAEIPYIKIEPNEVRTLKTKASERKVPLVGEALWAAKQALCTEGEALFPRVLDKWLDKDNDREFESNATSSALNSWLHENGLTVKGQSVHSLRHSLRDRLRAVLTPPDVQDDIGGWEGKGVGAGYGNGHSLKTMHEYMLKIVLN